MTDQPQLSPGLYELLVTSGLTRLLDDVDHELLSAATEVVDDADVPHVLTQHLSSVLESTLSELPKERQIDTANQVLSILAEASGQASIAPGPKILTSVSATPVLPPARPSTPLRDVALFTNSHLDPQLGSELRLEMGSADRIDLLCAFVQWSGIRVLEAPLREAAERGVPIRVLTTTYIGATDRRALDFFVRQLGAEVRVNYESQSTHLHAKAWMFHRRSGFPTAYVGSSNMSRAALVDGLEWNVRLSQHATPTLLDKFNSTFAGYWDNPAFATYDPDTDAEFLDAMLAKNRGGPSGVAFDSTYLDVRPYPHQQIMLDDLASERLIHGRHRNLLVAATGTGKTVIAALDYRRLAGRGPKPALLFLAHRKEILEQALSTYRAVLKDPSFGELYVDGNRPRRWQHVFASVQSLSNPDELARWSPTSFNVLVIDEFHHARARTYSRILDHFSPQELLGLTATPERADGVNVADYFFAGCIASELRLWDALEADLLVPFHYFGIADGVDLSAIMFRQGRYDTGQLSKALTGNDARARIILQAVSEKVTDVGTMRALGFCVTVEHAQYMAEVFSQAGIPAIALSGDSGSNERRNGLRKLRDGTISCIFAVDLFNEGLDIPMIDTVLMLRPTQSATIFLQQLGRGLRRTEGKSVLTVLDFVGMQSKQFRFDLKYRALTGLSRNRLENSIQEGFPFLPPGSQIVFDRVAEAIVLNNVRQQLKLSTKDLVADVRQHRPAGSDPSEYRMSEYLHDADRSLADIYGPGDRTFQGNRKPSTWTSVVDWAFPETATEISDPTSLALLRRVSNLVHVDDPQRINTYRRLLTAPRLSNTVDHDPFAAMLTYSFWPSGHPEGIHGALTRLRDDPAVTREVLGLLEHLEVASRSLPEPLGGLLAKSPLRSHAHYSREELLAGLGLGTLDPGHPGSIREGVKWLPSLRTDALLVTIKKSEAEYSPSTLYRDYAINQEGTAARTGDI